VNNEDGDGVGILWGLIISLAIWEILWWITQ
jgi:hypothetical protein